MRFEINTLDRNGMRILELTDTESDSKLHILPFYGALWHAWYFSYGGEPLNLLDQYADKETLEHSLRASFKGTKLSPFACRIPGGSYAANGKNYQFRHLSPDGNVLHGLLFDKPFKVKEKILSDRFAAATLEYAYRQEDEGYPFDYDCRITYQLGKDNVVKLSTSLHNLSSEKIPVMDGWHPYFSTGTPIDRCMLQFNAEALIEFNESLVPTGRMQPYSRFRSPEPLKDTALDNSFLIAADTDGPVCTLYDPEKNINIAFSPDKHYPVLQIYIPPDRQSIAIENLSGAPNAFNNGMSLKWINPGEKMTFETRYHARRTT